MEMEEEQTDMGITLSVCSVWEKSIKTMRFGMSRKFLIIYGIIIATVTIFFLIFGERKDPRYYITMLILAIAGKVLSKFIDNRE